MRIPKVYSIPNHPIAAADYVPPRTTDELEADRRRGIRGTNALITEEQGYGIRVAERALARLRETDEEHLLARLIGGTMLLSANYMFNSVEYRRAPVMYRDFKLPEIASEQRDDVMTENDYDELVSRGLNSTARSSFELAHRLGDGTFTKREVERLARSVGTLGVAIANYPLDLAFYDENDQDVALYQEQVKKNTTDVHNEAIAIAHRIGYVPSLAQFAEPSSPLSVDLRTNREYPIAMVRAFRDAQEEAA